MTKTSKLFLILIFIIPIFSFGQNDCGDKVIDTLPGAFFGPDLLQIFGVDTIVTEKKGQIIYSCEYCSITCKDSSGLIKWTKDLSKLNCRVISFSMIQKNKVKGYDIFIQFKDKTIYGMNSKNGKMKSFDKYIKRHDKKLNKHQ
jgi:hypothetical protein